MSIARMQLHESNWNKTREKTQKDKQKARQQGMTSPTPVNTPQDTESPNHDWSAMRCAPTFLFLGVNPGQPNRKSIRRKTSSAEWNNLRMTVLTVDHNEIDEGNNLTNVGHSATNVNSAKRLRDALEHCNGRTEGARLALVHLSKSMDTNVNPGPFSVVWVLAHTYTMGICYGIGHHNIIWRVLRIIDLCMIFAFLLWPVHHAIFKEFISFADRFLPIIVGMSLLCRPKNHLHCLVL